MTRLNTTELLSLAVLGAIVATLCDASHVFTHTLSYPSPFVAGQAWWVFPGIFLAVIMGIGGMLAEGLMSHFGQVTYRHVDFFYVPFWLGGLYMHGAFALRESMRFFVYR